MRLENITAVPHPLGNRIDLKWFNPSPDEHPGVHVMRKEATHPTAPEDGVLVADINAFLFSIELSFQNDLDNRTLSIALRQKFTDNLIHLTENARVTIEVLGDKWQIIDGAQMYMVRKEIDMINIYSAGLTYVIDQSLQGEKVYYYTLFPHKGDPPEYQIDPHNRTSAMATAPYNMAGQMYELLPIIYHRYDTVPPKMIPDRLSEEDKQRGQLRRFLDLPGSQLDLLYSFAKAMLEFHNFNKVDGRLLPLLAQWIGWKTDYSLEIQAQRNEIKNAPAIYKTIGLIPTVEATVKRISGWESRTKEFVHNVFLSNRPERLNIWAHQRSSSGEWSEPSEPLSLDFAYEGRPTAVRDGEGTIWLFYHTLRKGQWDIWYKTYREDREERWTPSLPLINGATINKYPSSVFHDGSLWVFWTAYDEIERSWSIECQVRDGGGWSECESLPFGNDGVERRHAFAVVDDAGKLWLFWLERAGIRWQLKYNQYSDGVWGSTITFPLDGGQDPRVDVDFFVLFHPTEGPDGRLWVFWARQEPTGEPDQMRWILVYRIKANFNLDATGWGNIQSFSTLPPEYHDREPSAFVNAEGNIELFWSSNRDGSWSIWQRTHDMEADTWRTEVQVTANPYSQRDPLPLNVSDGLLILYRSNESLTYDSQVYRATKTVDFRYSGSTTVNSRNAAKIALRGKFEDFQTYTYDAGINEERTDNDRYARDTIGLYLDQKTMDTEEIVSGVSRIRKVLTEFMPITDRPVFIIEPNLHIDYVYTYEQPRAKGSKHIAEYYKDSSKT